MDSEEAEANFLRSLAMKDEGRAEQTCQRQIFGSRIIKQGGGGSSLGLLTHFISQGSTAQAPKPWFFTDHLPNTASLPHHPQFREVRGHLLETTLV